MAYNNKTFNALADMYIKDTLCDGQLFCGCRAEDCESYRTIECRKCLLKQILDKEFEQLVKKETNNIMEEHIDFLELPTRMYNSLIRNGINTIEKLCNRTYWDIYKIRNMGKDSLEELTRVMKVYDLHFKECNDEF